MHLNLSAPGTNSLRTDFLRRLSRRLFSAVAAFVLVTSTSAFGQVKWAPGEQAIYAEAQKLMAAGRAAEAIPLGEKRLALSEKHFGKGTDSANAALEALGNYCLEADDLKRARECFTGAMAAARKLHGKGDMWIPHSLRGLGRVEAAEGNYATALSLLQRGLKEIEIMFGREDILTALFLDDLAQTYTRKQDYKAAMPLYDRSLKVRRKLLGEDHPGVANVLINLSWCQRGLGRIGDAESSLTRALAIHEKSLGPDHPFTAGALDALGQLYLELNDRTRAAECMERSLAIQEKVYGVGSVGTILGLHNLAEVRDSQRQFDKAESLFRRALAAAEKSLGPNNAQTLRIKVSLGGMLADHGDREGGITLQREALAGLEKILGPDSPELVVTINNLALAIKESGKAGEAEPLFRRALVIAEKHFGADSVQTKAAVSNLVWCLHVMGRNEEALTMAVRSFELSCREWEELLTFGSEEQLEIAGRAIRPSVGASLGDAKLAATEVLRLKDSLAASLLENRLRTRAAGSASAAAKLASASERARLKLRDLIQQSAPKTEVEAARKAAAGAEKALAKKTSALGTSRRALHVTPEEVAAVIPPDTVLVEFSSHTVHGGKPDEPVKGAYTAIILAPGHGPKMVNLGENIGIEEKIEAAVKLIKEPPDGLDSAALDAAAEKTMKDLHSTLLAPVEALLPAGTQGLVLSPDADMHCVPFAALMGPDGKLAGEKYLIRYVSSGRDLLTPPVAFPKAPAAVLAGNPSYEKATGSTVPATNPNLSEVAKALSFAPLPGTAAEVEALSAVFRAAQWKVISLTGDAATELALAGSPSPAVLHLATHGFFLNPVFNREVLGGREGSIFSLGMANSGLALAGAETTARQWSQGRVPAPSSDGIVTADEAVSLPLNGTALVTLSACETALGITMPGSGVAGLKRALQFAGAKNLLTTLWPVADDETSAVMQAFYGAFLKGDNPGTALSLTQRDFLVRWRAEHGLWFALNRAAPFVLTATTRWQK